MEEEIPQLQGWSESGGSEEDFQTRCTSIILTNLPSHGNNTDKLTVLVNTQREYRERSTMYFTETWLQPHRAAAYSIELLTER